MKSAGAGACWKEAVYPCLVTLKNCEGTSVAVRKRSCSEECSGCAFLVLLALDLPMEAQCRTWDVGITLRSGDALYDFLCYLWSAQYLTYAFKVFVLVCFFKALELVV